jgi:hypothetical protein
MRRRELLVALAFLPAIARAEQLRRIAWLGPGSAEKQGHYIASFKQGMRENNLFEGKDYILDVQHAEGHYDRFPSMVQAAVIVGNSIRLAGEVESGDALG